MADNPPNIGELVPAGEHRRDAIHVAVLPVTAAEPLQPGCDVGFVTGSRGAVSQDSDNPIGIVDPFLRDTLQAGERFWLFIYPNTVTGMRHVWSHPALTVVPPE